MVGRDHAKAFGGIMDKVRKRINNFKVKSLSQAAKDILLKAIV